MQTQKRSVETKLPRLMVSDGGDVFLVTGVNSGTIIHKEPGSYNSYPVGRQYVSGLDTATLSDYNGIVELRN